MIVPNPGSGLHSLTEVMVLSETIYHKLETITNNYRPPSAVPEAVTLLKLSDEELVLFGDLNWDWLSTSASALKDLCDTLWLMQLINSQTRLNIKPMDKATLLDVILTSSPHKYSVLLELAPFFSIYKRFDEQAFLSDIDDSDPNLVCEMPDDDIAWNFFFF